MGFENSAGLSNRNHYGPRTIDDEKFGGEVTTSGNDKQVEWVFDYDDLPSGTSGLEMETYIPAKSYIKRAYLEVLTAMAGTSGTLTMGLEQRDGTAIDADGIDAAVAQAALVANAVIACDGALVGGTVNTGANDGVLVVTTGGTVTAGRFKLVVEYEDGHVDGSGRYTGAGGTKA